jgi:ABC-type transport system involved in multi-copper enzyme maturation permease subunit
MASLSVLSGTNPVLGRELRVALRNERAFALLAFYVAILGAVVASQFPPNETILLLDSNAIASGSRGRDLYWTFCVTQAVLVLLLLPALAAGALAQEREHGTLEALLLTPLTPLQIVWGKAAGILAFVALLLLGTLPLTSLCFLLGGVSPGDVIGAYAVLLGLAACVSGFGLYCSAKWPNATQATVACYGLLPIFLLILTMFFAPGSVVAGLFLLVGAIYGIVVQWRRWAETPWASRWGRWYGLLLVLMLALLFFALAALLAQSRGLGIFWVAFVAPYLLFVARLTLQQAAVEIARRPDPRCPLPERLGDLKEEWRRAVAPPPVVYLPAPTGEYTYTPQFSPTASAKKVKATYNVESFLSDKINPILARDLRAGLLGKFSYLVRFAYLATIGTELLLLFLLLAGADDWFLNARSGRGLFVSWSNLHLALLMTFGALFGARALAPEREQQTLPQLLMIPLPPQAIIGGKIMAVSVYTFYIFVMGVPLALLLPALGVLSWKMALIFLMLEVVFGAFAAAWGLHCSLRAATVRRALGWALGGVLGLLMASVVFNQMDVFNQMSAFSTSWDGPRWWHVTTALGYLLLPSTVMSTGLASVAVAFAPAVTTPGASSQQMWWMLSALIYSVATLFLMLKTVADFRRYARTG